MKQKTFTKQNFKGPFDLVFLFYSLYKKPHKKMLAKNYLYIKRCLNNKKKLYNKIHPRFLRNSKTTLYYFFFLLKIVMIVLLLFFKKKQEQNIFI